MKHYFRLNTNPLELCPLVLLSILTPVFVAMCRAEEPYDSSEGLSKDSHHDNSER
jgi:hypothetical protein